MRIIVGFQAIEEDSSNRNQDSIGQSTKEVQSSIENKNNTSLSTYISPYKYYTESNNPAIIYNNSNKDPLNPYSINSQEASTSNYNNNQDNDYDELIDNEILSAMAYHQRPQALSSSSGCGLEVIDRGLTKAFHWLGMKIGENPSYFIIIPIFVSLLLGTGMQRLIYVDDPEYLFSPVDGKAKFEREVVDNLFPMNYSDEFHPSRFVRPGRFLR